MVQAPEPVVIYVRPGAPHQALLSVLQRVSREFEMDDLLPDVPTVLRESQYRFLRGEDPTAVVSNIMQGASPDGMVVQRVRIRRNPHQHLPYRTWTATSIDRPPEGRGKGVRSVCLLRRGCGLPHNMKLDCRRRMAAALLWRHPHMLVPVALPKDYEYLVRATQRILEHNVAQKGGGEIVQVWPEVMLRPTAAAVTIQCCWRGWKTRQGVDVKAMAVVRRAVVCLQRFWRCCMLKARFRMLKQLSIIAKQTRQYILALPTLCCLPGEWRKLHDMHSRPIFPEQKLLYAFDINHNYSVMVAARPGALRPGLPNWLNLRPHSITAQQLHDHQYTRMYDALCCAVLLEESVTIRHVVNDSDGVMDPWGSMQILEGAAPDGLITSQFNPNIITMLTFPNKDEAIVRAVLVAALTFDPRNDSFVRMLPTVLTDLPKAVRMSMGAVEPRATEDGYLSINPLAGQRRAMQNPGNPQTPTSPNGLDSKGRRVATKSKHGTRAGSPKTREDTPESIVSNLIYRREKPSIEVPPLSPHSHRRSRHGLPSPSPSSPLCPISPFSPSSHSNTRSRHNRSRSNAHGSAGSFFGGVFDARHGSRSASPLSSPARRFLQSSAGEYGYNYASFDGMDERAGSPLKLGDILLEQNKIEADAMRLQKTLQQQHVLLQREADVMEKRMQRDKVLHTKYEPRAMGSGSNVANPGYTPPTVQEASQKRRAMMELWKLVATEAVQQMRQAEQQGLAKMQQEQAALQAAQHQVTAAEQNVLLRAIHATKTNNQEANVARAFELQTRKEKVRAVRHKHRRFSMAFIRQCNLFGKHLRAAELTERREVAATDMSTRTGKLRQQNEEQARKFAEFQANRIRALQEAAKQFKEDIAFEEGHWEEIQQQELEAKCAQVKAIKQHADIVAAFFGASTGSERFKNVPAARVTFPLAEVSSQAVIQEDDGQPLQDQQEPVTVPDTLPALPCCMGPTWFVARESRYPVGIVP